MNNSNTTSENLSKLDVSKFNKTIEGKTTQLIVLKNESGAEMCVTNYGCAIVSIMVPDKQGKYANVVLGHDSIDHVVNSPEPFLNTTIGRYGNRICKGKFQLDGQTYSLFTNNGPNALHGGPTGFHARVWDIKAQSAKAVTFTYTAADGEEGFPGNLKVEMTYKWEYNNGKNELHIEYAAVTDKSTPVNLTNHAFFNLAGISAPTPSTEQHTLQLLADFFIPIDNTSIPTGEIRAVEGTPMDFRKPHAIGQLINEPYEQLIHGAGYDHCYVVNKKENNELALAAVCSEETSGRVMEVYTTEPGVQLYTGNWLNGFEGAHGATFPARSGVCFEAQRFPDTPNRPYFPTATLVPGENYTQTTIYAFSVN